MTIRQEMELSVDGGKMVCGIAQITRDIKRKQRSNQVVFDFWARMRQLESLLAWSCNS